MVRATSQIFVMVGATGQFFDKVRRLFFVCFFFPRFSLVFPPSKNHSRTWSDFESQRAREIWDADLERLVFDRNSYESMSETQLNDQKWA